MPTIFYVYEHWRPDIGACFWVGKGSGQRAVEFRRNPHYNKIIAKLRRMGLKPVVKIIASDLTEDEAFALEREQIAIQRQNGAPLANYSDGGEGPAGYRHTAETRAQIRIKRSAQVIAHSEETRKKIGAANSIALKGRKNPEHSVRLTGRVLTSEHKAAISRGLKGIEFSAERRANISAGLRGIKFSAERIENLRKSHIGKTATEETRRKMREAQIRRWARVKEAATCQA